MDLYYLIDDEVDVLMNIAEAAHNSSLINNDILEHNIQNIITDDPRLSIKQLKFWVTTARKVRFKNISFLSAAINEFGAMQSK